MEYGLMGFRAKRGVGDVWMSGVDLFQRNVHALMSCRYEFDEEHFKMFTKKNLHSILARKTILLKEAFYGCE